MGSFWDFFKAKDFVDKLNENEDLEKQMDLYGLEEVEREFVRRGDYEPYNFEEPESGEKLDEDDYYYEDE